MPDDDNNVDVNDIISQLKDFSRGSSKEEEISIVQLDDDESLENYVVNSAQSLINMSLGILKDSKRVIDSTNEKGALALAELITSTSAAIETLSKVSASNKRLKTSVHIKQMDIDAKRENNVNDNATKLMISNKDIMKVLEEAESKMKDADVISVTTVPLES